MVNGLIIEDEGLFQDMLKISLDSLDSLDELDVVGAVADGESAIEYADRLNPDVVLMDIELGSEPNGIAAGKAIIKRPFGQPRLGQDLGQPHPGIALPAKEP